MKKAIEKTGKYTKMQVASQASQINRFVNEMNEGDIAISPV
jgi:predicted Mrr-cat superfamily restriction endonuclease